MAEYLTNTADLTAVANAIRAKGGTSAQLVYPSGFVSAIQAIQTGITPKLVVTTSAGAAVTAAKGSRTVTGTAGTDGTCTLELPEAGAWSVTSAKDGLSSTQSIVIGTQSVSLLLIDPVFANNTWAQIIEACQAGLVPAAWAVGDSKTMSINGAEYQVDIIGKNHDEYADGSGTAPLTFQLHDCYGTLYAMNTASTVGMGSWKSSVMRSAHLPALMALMPEAVRDGIRQVNKLTAAPASSGFVIETTAETLFLLSEVEVFGATSYSEQGEGTQYDYYLAGGNKVKTRNGTNAIWWERSPTKSSQSTQGTNFCAVYDSGVYANANATGSYGVSFAFCF